MDKTIKIDSPEIFDCSSAISTVDSFFALDQDISSCLNVNSMDTLALDMDSSIFYDIDKDSKVKESLDTPTLGDLNPSFELSYDLGELIEKAALGDNAAHLFPEIDTHVDTTDLSVQGKSYPIVKLEETDIELMYSDLPQSVTDLDETQIETGENSPAFQYIEVVPEQSVSETVSQISLTVTPQQAAAVADFNQESQQTHKNKAASSKGLSKRRQAEKGTNEYIERRERNNVAVRKSRDKAKQKQAETETRMKLLVSENEQLQKKCDLLTKELTVLKGLFTNVGASVPIALNKLLK